MLSSYYYLSARKFALDFITIDLLTHSNDKISSLFSDVTINNPNCDNGENQNDKALVKPHHKDSTSIKKEIIGILKPPNLKKELKSFPSLPECFLHDLGLLDNFALRYLLILLYLQKKVPILH